MTSRLDDEVGSGVIHFIVGEDGGPAASPSPTSPPDDDPTPGPGGAHDSQGPDGAGGPNVVNLALLTIGAAGGAAAFALLLFFVRLRVGFWFHRPPPREEGEAAEHH
jgi:hypothetical protein